MSADFYSAQIPESRWCLGFRLLPLSLGHLIILRRIKNAFVCEGSPDFSDLATAVLVCSNTYEDALVHINYPDLDLFMRRWHDRLTGTDRWLVRMGFKLPMVLDFATEAALFCRYFNENSSGPNYSFEPEKVRESSSPPELTAKVTLMRNLQLTESQVLNRPWILCLWDLAEIRQQDGHVQIIDDNAVNEAHETARKLHEMIQEGRISHG